MARFESIAIMISRRLRLALGVIILVFAAKLSATPMPGPLQNSAPVHAGVDIGATLEGRELQALDQSTEFHP